MNVAIPQWRERVSPVFDSSHHLLVAECGSGEDTCRRLLELSGQSPVARARCIREAGIDVLVCGALSRSARASLQSVGVRVVSGVCGPVEDVLRAFLENRLEHPAYRMPGASAAPCRGKDHL